MAWSRKLDMQQNWNPRKPTTANASTTPFPLSDDNSEINECGSDYFVFAHSWQSSVEEVIAATAYFDMFLRRVTEPGLMKIFLKYILLGKMDDIVIIESLIDRIISPITRVRFSIHLNIVYLLEAGGSNGMEAEFNYCWRGG